MLNKIENTNAVKPEGPKYFKLNSLPLRLFKTT